MAVNGLGSRSSPIVISDDEDAAYVEQQLGVYETGSASGTDRFARDDSNDEGDGNLPESLAMNHNVTDPVAGQKRKRNDSQPSQPFPFQGESKTARKKRRRREREAQLAQGLLQVPPPAVPPAPAMPPAYTSAPLPASVPAPLQPKKARRNRYAAMPDLPTLHISPEILPPVSWSPTSPNFVPTLPHVHALPRKPSTLTTFMGDALVNEPKSSSSAALPLSSRLSHAAISRPAPDTAAVSPALPAPPAVSPPPPPIAPPFSTQSPAEQSASKKPIGMHLETDASGSHGLYASPREIHPTRTLVLEHIPKKFRNWAFINDWAKNRRSRYIHFDPRTGKAAIEFQTADSALEAFNSPRLSGEGKEHIRAYWYRGSPAGKPPPPDLEEGEIAEGVAEEPSVEQKATGKKKKKQKQKKKTQDVEQQVSSGQAELGLSRRQLDQQDEEALWDSIFRKSQPAAQSGPKNVYSHSYRSASKPVPSNQQVSGLSTDLSTPAHSSTPTRSIPPHLRGPKFPKLQDSLMSTISPSAPSHAFLPQNIPEPWGTLHPTISPNATEPRFNIGNYYGSLNNMPYSQQPQLFQHYGLSQVVTNPFPPLPPPPPQLHVPPPPPPPEPNPELHVAEDPIPVPEFDEEQAMDLESDAGDGDVYMVIDSGPTMAGTDPSLPDNINDDMDDGHSIASSRAQSPVPAPAKRPYEPYQTSSDDSPIPGLSMGERPAATPSPAPPTPVEEEESSQPPSSDERKAVSTLNPTVACWVPLNQRPDKPAAGTSAEPVAVEEISTPQETRTDPPKLSIQQPVRQVRAVPLPMPSPTIVTVQKLAALASTPETGVDRGVPASKRSLLERQRELEERIAYVKEELARRGVAGSISAASAETTSSSVASGSGYATRGSTPSQVAADGESRPAIDTGKRQVPTMAPLQIQPSDAPLVPPLPTPALSESTSATGTNKSRSTSPSLEDAVTPESGASTGKSLNGATMSLDELAISFITETIQTVNTPPPPAAKPTPPPEKMSQAAEKMLLAAKQKRLEQHIAESKMLMAKLGTARSKEERESILSTLRERRRAMEEDMKADAVSVVQPTSAMSPTPLPAAPAPPPFSRPQSAQSWKTRWPETAREANILIISDDEDDEDDE